MKYDSILSNVARYVTLQPQEAHAFTSLLRHREVPRKEFLLKAGQTARQISFIHSGALKAYYLDASSVENIIMLAVDDWWITDMYSFSMAKPAMQYISAIEDSEVFQLQRNDFDKLLAQFPVFEKFFRILMQNAYIREQLRIIQNLSMPAEDRYVNFLNKYPQLVQRVSQKQIASYIGVSPEFLSAMRRRLSEKNKT